MLRIKSKLQLELITQTKQETMDIRTIKNFLKLTEHLNYRRTSEDILLAQPALSRQIKQLEDDIGAVLFERTKRHVFLTEGGKYFKKEMERLIPQWENACLKTAQIHRGEAGEIRIGHSSSAMQSILPNLLVEIKNHYPDLHVILAEIPNRELIENLHLRTVDIGFVPNIDSQKDIEHQVVYEENFVLILPKNHPIDVEKPLNWSDLKDEKFIIPSLKFGMGYVEKIHQMLMRYGGFSPNIIHESAYSTSVLRLVEAGLGISIEPKSTLKGWNINIKSLELKNISHNVQIKMLWLKERTEEFSLFFEMVKKSRISD
jgi:DNA-binding transcriptional LysR family regulator